MSFEALAVEDMYAERGAPERPTFSPKAAPCDGCEHAARCAKERLACCAYAKYAGSLSGHRTLRREPSAAWYAFVEVEGPMPACANCGQVRPMNKNIRVLVARALQGSPGLTARDVGAAAGISRAAAKSALERMRDSGQAEVSGHAKGGPGGPAALWRLT